MLRRPWHIALLGGLRAEQGDLVITRFQTHKTGALLAYLAFYRTRSHPREVLIELLWPDADLDSGRMSLRSALASLRRQLEPPGVPAGTVIRADRANVELNPGACTTDVAELELALATAMQSSGDPEAVRTLTKAVELYRGELLPGFYEDWVSAERSRLEQLHQDALYWLVRTLIQKKELDRALDFAQRLVHANPLREEAHRTLMRLYGALGQPSAALQQYQELERLLREVGSAPSATTRQLVTQLEAVAAPTAGAPPTHPIPRPEMPPAEPAPAGGEALEPPRLPLQFSRFFGREAEIAQLTALLAPPPPEAEKTAAPRSLRQVTLTGMGGAGKTRLALEVAERLMPAFADAVWYVPLADLSNPRLIAPAILEALRLPPAPRREPWELVTEFLNRQSALLVLDNFEHLAAGGAPLLLNLMKQVPGLTCLVTSRRRLGLPGEREIPLMPLPLPADLGATEPLTELACVQLFVDRAQAVRPDFQVTRGNAAAIAELCRKLEGIPLALELAAARAQTLTPAQMLERLSQRFELLVTRRVDKDAPHRSLWTAIDWSYHLLTPELRRLFAHLSIFRGGWTLEAAEAVCEEPAALEYLAQLRERSLIVPEETGAELRFRMLETLREYAAEQLEDSERADLAGRHAEFYLRTAEAAEPLLQGPDAKRWLARLESDHDNLRAVQEWCLEAPVKTESALRLGGTLWQFWSLHGHVAEGRDWLTRMLAHTQDAERSRLLARALTSAATLAHIQTDLSGARALFEESLAIARALDLKPSIAVGLSNLGNLLRDQGDYSAARALQEESVVLAREIGDRPKIGAGLNNLANVAMQQGDMEMARVYLEESREIYRELGNVVGIAGLLTNLGIVAYGQGDLEQARAYQEESVAIRRELGDKVGMALSLGNLAETARLQGDYMEAHVAFEESLILLRELGSRQGMVHVLEGLATVAAELGQGLRAARLYGAGEKLREVITYPMPDLARDTYIQQVERAREGVDASAFAAAWAEGRAMSLEQALSFAVLPGQEPQIQSPITRSQVQCKES